MTSCNKFFEMLNTAINSCIHQQICTMQEHISQKAMRGQAKQLSYIPSFNRISFYQMDMLAMFTVPWYIPGWITVVPSLSLGISWIVIRPAPLIPVFFLRRFPHYWNISVKLVFGSLLTVTIFLSGPHKVNLPNTPSTININTFSLSATINAPSLPQIISTIQNGCHDDSNTNYTY